MKTKAQDKVKEIDQAIDKAREEASSAWANFDKLRGELAASDVDVTDENSEAFTKAHEAHQAYGEKADEVQELSERREALWAMVAEGDEDPSTKAVAKQREQVKDGLHSRESAGARIIGGDAYKQLRDSGALSSKGHLGNIQLGEAMTREEFYASLVVTDPEGDNTVRPFIEPMHRGFIEPRFRPLSLLDLISIGTTDSDSIDYVVETGWTNNAAPVAEASTEEPIGSGDPEITPVQGGRKPQSALNFEKKDEPVKTLAHWLASTKKSLRDAARLRSIVDNRLTRGLYEVLEDQVVEGDGTDENFTGIVNTTGVQHQERGAGPLVEDILKAMTKVRLAFFPVLATGINPLDFEGIRLQREGAGSGTYLYGPPSQAGPTTIWGAPTVQGPQFPQAQPIVGDFSVVELYIREGVQVLASDSHEDFFTRNLVAILAEMSAGLVIPQPEGLCEVSDT